MVADRCARVLLSAARVILSPAKDLAQRRISRPHRPDGQDTALPPGLLHRTQRLGTRTHTVVDAPGAAIVSPWRDPRRFGPARSSLSVYSIITEIQVGRRGIAGAKRERAGPRGPALARTRNG